VAGFKFQVSAARDAHRPGTRLSTISLLFVTLLLGCLVKPVAAQDVAGDLLGRINNLRGTQGLPGYTINGSLTSAAADQARWMVDNGCAIAHVRPDGSSPRTRAAAFGYQTTDVSENIYCGSNAGTDNAWTFWINSGIHYAGLVNTRYKEIGIASARGAGGQAFVLVFGNPGGPAFVPAALLYLPRLPGVVMEQPLPARPLMFWELIKTVTSCMRFNPAIRWGTSCSSTVTPGMPFLMYWR